MKIEKGGWILIFLIGLALVGYSLKRYGVIDMGKFGGGSSSSSSSGEKLDTSKPLAIPVSSSTDENAEVRIRVNVWVGCVDGLVANGGLWVEQVKAICITLLLAVIGTVVIAYVVKMVMGLRPAEDVEIAGLDISEHGEEGYHSGDAGGSIVAGAPAAAAIGHAAPAISRAAAS